MATWLCVCVCVYWWIVYMAITILFLINSKHQSIKAAWFIWKGTGPIIIGVYCPIHSFIHITKIHTHTSVPAHSSTKRKGRSFNFSAGNKSVCVCYILQSIGNGSQNNRTLNAISDHFISGLLYVSETCAKWVWCWC